MLRASDGYPANPGPLRGPAGVKEFISTYHAAFPDARITVEQQLAEGNLVATRWIPAKGQGGDVDRGGCVELKRGWRALSFGHHVTGRGLVS
jgi:SnoaL-like polyketide cyclase